MEDGLAQDFVKDKINALEVLDSKSNERVEVSLNEVNATQVEYTITFKSKRGLSHVVKC